MPTELRKPQVSPSAPGAPVQKPIIPRGMIVGAGLVMLFTIAVAGLSRHYHAYHVDMGPTSAVESRDLLFADQRDGGVLVTDAKTGQRVALVKPTTGGFLRGIMRGLVREHKLNDLATGTPFRLTQWADGRLSIADPSTKESFDLEAFGSTNEQAFASLLRDDPRADGIGKLGDGATPNAAAKVGDAKTDEGGEAR